MLLITALITYKVPSQGTAIKFSTTETQSPRGLEELLQSTLYEIALATNGNYQIISVSHTITNQLEKQS
jgi:hypothetical protein